jgi:hypothetical protein
VCCAVSLISFLANAEFINFTELKLLAYNPISCKMLGIDRELKSFEKFKN